MASEEEDLIRKRLAERGYVMTVVGESPLLDIAAEIVREERAAAVKRFREYADTLWAEAKIAKDPAVEKALKVVCTELHRQGQMALGEEPLPAAGASLEGV